MTTHQIATSIVSLSLVTAILAMFLVLPFSYDAARAVWTICGIACIVCGILRLLLPPGVSGSPDQTDAVESHVVADSTNEELVYVDPKGDPKLFEGAARTIGHEVGAFRPFDPWRKPS